MRDPVIILSWLTGIAQTFSAALVNDFPLWSATMIVWLQILVITGARLQIQQMQERTHA